MRAFPSLVAVLILLAACGTKGELVRPPGPPPKPVLDSLFPAPAAEPAKDSKPAAAAGEAKP